MESVTCRVCFVKVGRQARLTVADIIERPDSELVVHIRGQLEVSRGLSARHLCQVMPNATVM